jgi:hypothetical protein
MLMDKGLGRLQNDIGVSSSCHVVLPLNDISIAVPAIRV